MSLFRGFMHDFEDDPFFGYVNIDQEVKNFRLKNAMIQVGNLQEWTALLILNKTVNGAEQEKYDVWRFPAQLYKMSTFKKNSVAYTIPVARKNIADDDDDDDDDDVDFTQNHKSENPHSSHVNPMHHMSSMMNSMLADPFGMMGGFGSSRHQGSGRQLMPFGFPNMNDIFQNFQMNTNDPNCHSFSSSTVMTMSSGPDGRPQVYQASHSTRTAPGGIRETQKSVCDSRTGTKKLAIGHHIGERSHVLEREQNMHSGQMEERQEFVNLDEDEAEDFNREWETKTRSGMNAIGYGQSRMRHRRPRDDIPAVLDSFSSEGSPEKSKKRCQEVVGEPSNLKEEDKTSESSGRKHLKQRKRSPRKKIN